MPVQNRIVKVQKRNRALVRFDQSLIQRAIQRAADSIGGFQQDLLPDINGRLFDAWPQPTDLAGFLSDAVVVCLNSNPQHFIANFPPTIERIQDAVLHVLRSHGFQNTADAYECYRWSRHWLREGAVPAGAFAGNGRPPAAWLQQELDRNRRRGCHTAAALGDLVRSGKLRPVIEESIANYEASLDDAARGILERHRGGGLRMIWICGPSSSGKTTTTVKITRRLERDGLRFLMLNLDDYFWPLVEHPTDWINDRNYETPEALDIQLLNRHLRELLEGRPVEAPVYNFIEGRRTGSRSVRLDQGQILLLDCLHGLYPPMTEGIPSDAQFRLVVDARPALLEGDGATGRPVQSSDIRLLRRMLRDSRHRNHSPLRTLLHWHYVRTGELFSILPLSGLADHVINGAFPFDLPALHPFLAGPGNLLPPLSALDNYPGFLDARIRLERVRSLLGGLGGLTIEQLTAHDLIPGDALVREFIGHSTLSIPHNH
ncbi:MAG: ATP cone domain-containing protein [Verrucomicrobiota bacterium]